METVQDHQASGSHLPASLAQIPLAPNDPFDWETFIAPYKGLTKIDKLIYLATSCPQLRKPCAAAALELVQQTTMDTRTYQNLITVHNTNPNGSLIPASETIASDSQWIQSTEARNQAEREKLDLEMRSYQNNLIKESIRMAHRDLGDHFKATGQLEEALRCYIKTRDFCSTSEHIIEMCLNVIDVSLRLKKFNNVQTFVSKAEGVLESYKSSTTKSAPKLTSSVAPPTKGASTPGADAIGALFRSGGSSSNNATTSSTSATTASAAAGSATFGDGVNGSGNTAKRHMADIHAKLTAASVLAYLGLAKYELAAKAIIELDPYHAASLGDYLSPSDLAVYIVLCSLATMERGPLKSQILQHRGVRLLLENEHYALELLEAFAAGEFEKVERILDTWNSRHMLDMTLAPHFQDLRSALTRRALRQFFTPFDRVSISRMAKAFGWTTERMAKELVSCVERGDFKNLSGNPMSFGESGDARIDWQNKIIEYKQVDPRQKLYQSTLELADNRQRDVKRLFLRSKLLQHDLVIKDQRDPAEELHAMEVIPS